MKPKCLCCQKPLRPARRREEAWWIAAGKGPWGDYGDGHFCGLRCAHAWAVDFLKRHEILAETLHDAIENKS